MFGKGSTYRSWGKELEFPRSYFNVLARWDQLSVMAGTKAFAELRHLANFSTEPQKIERFVHFVENDLGFNLYRSVNDAKSALSTQRCARFEFDEAGVRIAREITRCNFERWIEPELADIDRCIDAALQNAGQSASDIDKVFLTGGSSLVPAVRALFEWRFSPAKTESGEELVSVVSGLALVGADRNLERWTVGTS